MNSFNQTNFNERDNNYNNQISLNKSEKFQDAVNNMRLMMWNRFLAGVASNPHMTKKEVCHHLGLKVGTTNSIQQHYKLQSPFYFNKPKTHKKKKENETLTLSNKSLARDNSYNKKEKIEKVKSLKGGATNPKEITDEYIDRLIN